MNIDKIMEDMHTIATRCARILDILKDYNLCEIEDEKALMAIKAKAIGALKCAEYFRLNQQEVVINSDKFENIITGIEAQLKRAKNNG